MRGAGVVPRVAAAVLAVVVLAGCSAGPSTRPPLALRDTDVAPADVAPPSASTPATPAPATPVEVPVTELDWQDCTGSTRSRLALPEGPAGLVLECTTLEATVDPALSGRLELGLLRARLTTTPADAGPLVLVAGAEEPATTRLARAATSTWGPLLADRPVVALDRRGTGESTPVSCLTSDQRDALVDVDPAAPGESDPLGALQQLGRDATLSCTDVLTPAETAFDVAHAATDLFVLRDAWGVRALALLGSGGGTSTALRVAVDDPGSVSRLVLDSPTEPGADEVSLAEAAVVGTEAALDAFAASCAARGCPVPDPRAAVAALVEQARAQDGIGAPDGRRLSSGAVLVAVRQALLAPATATPEVLGAALAAATGGDATGLLGLVDAATGRAAPGAGGSQLDAGFVAGCSDAALRPTADQVTDVLADWTERYPLFGPSAAARLVLCLAWPTPPTTPELDGLDALAPVLALAAAADPRTGPDATTATTQALAAAGASATTLRWQGTGNPVLVSSGCGVAAVVTYLDGGALPESGTICPP